MSLRKPCPYWKTGCEPKPECEPAVLWRMFHLASRAGMLVPFVCATSSAQKTDPMQDPDIWGADAASYHRALDSIVPDEWLVVPPEEPHAREIVSRWIL